MWCQSLVVVDTAEKSQSDGAGAKNEGTALELFTTIMMMLMMLMMMLMMMN
jgi:hypothetical protein